VDASVDAARRRARERGGDARAAVEAGAVAVAAAGEDARGEGEVRSIHWSPYDPVREVDADP
jgi:hypothetical protein